MEWQITLLIILGSLLILLLTGMPIAFSFMLVNLFGVFIFWGGEAGFNQLILSFLHSVPTFVLVPVPLFILMGEVMHYSGISYRIIDALDKLLGRLPGRLAIISVAAGVLFSVLSGSSLSSVAMLGSTLVPEMEKRGYQKSLAMGSIMGSGGLAMIIPPSAITVVLASLGKMSVGKLLISGIVPGLIMAVFFVAYIIVRCWMKPSLAPTYEVLPSSLADKARSLAVGILPLGLVVFLVLGLIFLGVATPSEAAATGVLGVFVLALIHKRLNWDVMKKSLISTIEITVMIFMIIVGATAFSQILASSGASRGLVELFVRFPLSPVIMVIAMQVVVLILGCFIDAIAIMMITLPIFTPILNSLGVDPIWFGLMMLINLGAGAITPPFGLILYVMKGVAPSNTKMSEITIAAIPYVIIEILVIVLIFIFPVVGLWLPSIIGLK